MQDSRPEPERGRPRRTNHRRWLLGALILCIPIPVLLTFQESEAPPPVVDALPALVEIPAPLPAPDPGAGPVTCGQCGGDGRIDMSDRDRRVPATLADHGDCPYCVGGTVGDPVSRPH